MSKHNLLPMAVRRTRYRSIDICVWSLAFISLLFASPLVIPTNVARAQQVAPPAPPATSPDAPAVSVPQKSATTPKPSEVEIEPDSTTVVKPSSNAWAPVTRMKELPNYKRYAELKSKMRSLQAGGRIFKVRWSKNGDTIGFTVNGQKKQFNVGDKTVTDRVANLVNHSLQDQAPVVPNVERAKQQTVEPSPNRKWQAVYRDHNVVIEPVGQKDVPAMVVTKEGNDRRRFGTCCWVYGEELDQNTAMWWSPDSRMLAYYEVDESGMKDYHLTVDNTGLYTRVETIRYPMAGDANPKVALHVFDLDTRQKVKVNVPDDKEYYLYNVRFSPSGQELIFSQLNRLQNHLDIVAADVRTGQTRVVLSETQETWQDHLPTMRFLADGKRFIWQTDRNGWSHFELRDLSGERLNDLSPPGDYQCKRVELIDESGKWFYYTAFTDENPYNAQLHRCKLDGSSHSKITTGAHNHTAFEIAPSHNWVVAVREGVDQPVATMLYHADGTQYATISETKGVKAAELGIPVPEMIRIGTGEGTPDIYATLFKPAGFDATKTYPLLVDVYGGPESMGLNNRWTAADPVCELGYLVLRVANRGTGMRGKAFESAVYQKLGQVDLDDQKLAVDTVAKRPYVDASRVGIYGHSYGGYLAALAVLRYPETFHVAVAGAPVTSWKNYDTIYTERYMRTPSENPDGYKAASCMRHAKELDGRLLLVHGLVDDNVHPANTWQLAKALQDNDQRFDMMIYPGFRHGVHSTYDAMRWEYFDRHLKPTLQKDSISR